MLMAIDFFKMWAEAEQKLQVVEMRFLNLPSLLDNGHLAEKEQLRAALFTQRLVTKALHSCVLEQVDSLAHEIMAACDGNQQFFDELISEMQSLIININTAHLAHNPHNHIPSAEKH